MPFQKQIHSFAFIYYGQMQSILTKDFLLIMHFDENYPKGRSIRGTFHFVSRIVNHINLLSYRHSGASHDLCGFNYMALLTNLQRYIFDMDLY